MKKERMKYFVTGVLVMALVVGLISTATATIGRRTVDVDYTDIKIELNGEKVTPTDANGNAVEPFAINGTTYLPVRAVGNALGLTVGWDGITGTVQLSEADNGINENAAQEWFQVMDAYHSMEVLADRCYVRLDLLMSEIENEVYHGTGNVSNVQSDAAVVASFKSENERIGNAVDQFLLSKDANVQSEAITLSSYQIKMTRAISDMEKAFTYGEDFLYYGTANQQSFYSFLDYYDSAVDVFHSVKIDSRTGYDRAYFELFDVLYGY